MQVQKIGGMPNFSGINITKLKTNPNQPAKIVAVMDEDTFERSNLPQTTDIKDLNGPYGHPYSGRPLEGIEHVPTAWEKFVEDGFSGLFEALSDGNEDMVEHMTNLMENDVFADTFIDTLVDNGVADALSDITIDEFTDRVSESPTGALGVMQDLLEGAGDLVEDVFDFFANLLGLDS